MTHNSKGIKDQTEIKVELLKASIKVLKAIDDQSILEAMRVDNIRGYTLVQCEEALNYLAMEGKIRLGYRKNTETGEKKLESIHIVQSRLTDRLLSINEDDDNEVRVYFNKMYLLRELGEELGMFHKDDTKLR